MSAPATVGSATSRAASPCPRPGRAGKRRAGGKKLGLRHVVLTCSTRDDLPDGGAEHFAKTVRAIRALCPGTTVETLTSDMKGSHEAADIVIAAHPDVFNLNIETVKELQKAVRPQAGYERTLGVLRYVKEKDPTILTKTGFMVGSARRTSRSRSSWMIFWPPAATF